ncbi:predicted protein [Thalassiosira pseudonana CCMP1335]|uniref:Uncharacterized protein n=1 Tax=Thalassiosira pseudonana TaxID=35128 RepID=B8C3L0_THAPS|nr:predicted protein [Thalassiosira pseudonana CCMP1335]EED92138.1 predicted protein [Thalassiosira pseudonana CCMP1335]|eukprot:scaffold932_cov207-Alexandrium_tamarense.AAC.23
MKKETSSPGAMNYTPSYVKPRISEIEQRMLSRSTPTRKPKASTNSSVNDNNGSSSSSSSHLLTNTPSPRSSSSLHNALLNYTPPPPPSSTSTELVSTSRFQFQGSSTNIKQFEADALKRQAEHSSRISDLEGRLASFHARLALESAERGREHSAVMEECVNEPLEGVMKRSLERVEDVFVRRFMDPSRADEIMMQQQQQQLEGNTRQTEEGNAVDSEEKNDSSEPTTPNLVAIERQTSLLESQMNHHTHITLYTSQRHNFHNIEDQFRSTLQPALSLETTKADKREGGMVRRFEASSGEYTRLVAELEAARRGELGYVEKEIDDWKCSDESRAESYLNEIEALKKLVREERDERKREDEKVVERILKTREMLQEDILALLGNDSGNP